MKLEKDDYVVYIPLAVATSLYAVVLDYLKDRIEPDWTWAEVVVGTTMCMVAAEVRSEMGPSDRAATLRAVRLAFAAGGTPVIIWQLLRMIARRRRSGRVLQRLRS